MSDELQASAELMSALQKSKLLDDLHANLKTRGPLLNLMKEQNPSLTIPEVDAVRAIEPQMQELRQTNLELKAQLAKQQIREQYGLSDEELIETARVMKDDGVSRIDTAIELQRARAAAAPRNSQASPLQLPNTQELFSDPKGWANREAHNVIEEIRRGRNRGY